MNPIDPTSNHVLRFSGVQSQVLKQLETARLKQESQLLFGENLDVFVKQDNPNSGTVELVAKNNAKSLFFGSGMIRNLNRLITGKDIKPTEEKIKSNAPEPTSDFFERTIGSQN